MVLEYRTSLVDKVSSGADAADAQEGKEVVFSEVRLFSMVRNDQYKLSVDSLTRQPLELYDMKSDPREIHNLVEDSAYASVCTELMENHLNGLLDKLDHDKAKKYQEALTANPDRGTPIAHVKSFVRQTVQTMTPLPSNPLIPVSQTISPAWSQ